MFSKIFQKVKIVMLRLNILQYLKKMLREYFSCNEKSEIFLTCFCNILCYVGSIMWKFWFLIFFWPLKPPQKTVFFDYFFFQLPPFRYFCIKINNFSSGHSHSDTESKFFGFCILDDSSIKKHQHRWNAFFFLGVVLMSRFRIKTY